MQLNILWVEDPGTKKLSVSLTNLVLSALVLVIAIGLNLANITKDTSSALAYFGLSASLYFGRKLSVGNQTFDSNNNNDKGDA